MEFLTEEETDVLLKTIDNVDEAMVSMYDRPYSKIEDIKDLLLAKIYFLREDKVIVEKRGKLIDRTFNKPFSGLTEEKTNEFIESLSNAFKHIKNPIKIKFEISSVYIKKSKTHNRIHYQCCPSLDNNNFKDIIDGFSNILYNLNPEKNSNKVYEKKL